MKRPADSARQDEDKFKEVRNDTNQVYYVNMRGADVGQSRVFANLNLES